MTKPPNSSGNAGPFEEFATDSKSSMEIPAPGHPSPARTDPQPDWRERIAARDRLAGDDLSELGLETVPSDALRRLRAAETWLRRTLDARPCPAPEVLYDYSSGPGAHSFGRPLSPELRAEVEDHLEHCAACSAACATLAQAPPPPLEIEDASAAGPFALDAALEAALGPPGRPADRTPAIPIQRMRWLPVAAAAAVLVAGMGLGRWRIGSSASEPTWPRRPTLRQAAEDALAFPRGRVLAGGPALAQGRVRFELARVEGAGLYRVRLARHDGSAFARGASVEQCEGSAPTLAADLSLEPGHYTWQGWAIVDGLERELGELDFQVVVDPAAAAGGTEGDLARILALHEDGYLTDARELARRQPPSPERDAYLALPGR